MTLPGQMIDSASIGFWGGWPPFAKLFFLLAPALGLVVCRGMPALACLWTIAVIGFALTWPGTDWLLTRILPMLGSIAFFAVWLPWTLPGEPVFEGYWWSPTGFGLFKAASLFLKGTGVAFCFLSLVRSFHQSELLATLQNIGIPPLFLTIAWITVQQTQRLLREWKSIAQAHRARGAFLKERADRTRLMATSWAQLFVRVQKRSEDLGDALKARGFSRAFFSVIPRKATPGSVAGTVILGTLVSLIVFFDLWGSP